MYFCEMKNWSYKNREIKTIDDLLCINENIIGFVYKITNKSNGKFYIGKKSLYNKQTKKITQKVIKETKTRKRKEVHIKESNWKTYCGSSVELLKDIATYSDTIFHREIIELCTSTKYLSYSEIKWQIKFDVLNQNTYNGNIMGRYYRKDVTNIIL